MARPVRSGIPIFSGPHHSPIRDLHARRLIGLVLFQHPAFLFRASAVILTGCRRADRSGILSPATRGGGYTVAAGMVHRRFGRRSGCRHRILICTRSGPFPVPFGRRSRRRSRCPLNKKNVLVDRRHRAGVMLALLRARRRCSARDSPAVPQKASVSQRFQRPAPVSRSSHPRSVRGRGLSPRSTTFQCRLGRT